MKTATYIMLAMGAAAMATIVAAEALNWSLSTETMMALSAFVGWVIKSPGDLMKKIAPTGGAFAGKPAEK